MLTVAATALFAVQAGTLRQLAEVADMMVVENGFDFVGHDVANGPGKDLNACKKLCQDRTDCKAFSWTDTNGGICWLKDGRGDVKVDANVKSSALWTADQISNLNVLQKDVDFFGNDIARVLGNTPASCVNKCKDTIGCRAFSWNGDNGGTCWLKSKRDNVISKAGVVSAIIYPIIDNGNSGRTVEANTDYVGHDMGNQPSPSYDGCFDICQRTPGCHVFSWSNYMGGTCWLKSWKDKTVVSAGVTSGVVSTSSRSCTWEKDGGIDYYINDIGNKGGINDRTDCCQLCKDTPGCTAFSWSDQSGGTCWFKSKKGDIKFKAGVYSGVIVV